MTERARQDQPRLRVLRGGSQEAAETLSDDALIDAFERGERQTAELLYDRLCDVVSGTVVKVTGGRGQDHEDLVQAAFEQIMVTLARRKFARACKLSSWAVSVTTNVALNSLRKRVRERRVIDERQDLDTVGRRQSNDAPPDQQVLMRALRQELATLNPDKANTLFMHDVLGHDLAEIAVLTGVSVAAAQSRLVRARSELRARLASRFPEGKERQ